ncbi:MAG: pyridoxine 5'-phosphate oxidase C-terminal domain-containing protein, partial [Candidatus Limnocylindrales bacterium]
FPDEDVPLPPFWGGYRVVPETLEFWQHGADRLHDRLRYRRPAATEAANAAGWLVERLQP